MNIVFTKQPPTKSQFQSATSVTFAYRKDDRILSHLDWLLEIFEKQEKLSDRSKILVILCDLFLTCNFWIKSFHEKNPRLKKERYQGVLALMDAVVKRIMVMENFRTPMAVARWLEETYGRDMDVTGIETDVFEQKARYMQARELELYRIRFRAGLAYQSRWYDGSGSKDLVIAESSRAFNPEVVRKDADASQNYGGFIMTPERVLYMAEHSVGKHNKKDGIFHSSYNHGNLVMMAGTMLIVRGRIRAIRPDSGHYRPTEMNMALMLQGLKMYGVDLRKINLFSFKGDPIATADQFLRQQLSWPALVKQRENELGHRAKTDERRVDRGIDPKFTKQPMVTQVAPQVPTAPVANPLNDGSSFYLS